MNKKPTQVWRTFSKRPIREHEEAIPWLIQVGDDPEDLLVAGFILNEGEYDASYFWDGRTKFYVQDVIRFAKINM